jgi:hypothetical protein
MSEEQVSKQRSVITFGAGRPPRIQIRVTRHRRLISSQMLQMPVNSMGIVNDFARSNRCSTALGMEGVRHKLYTASMTDMSLTPAHVEKSHYFPIPLELTIVTSSSPTPRRKEPPTFMSAELGNRFLTVLHIFRGPPLALMRPPKICRHTIMISATATRPACTPNETSKPFFLPQSSWK